MLILLCSHLLHNTFKTLLRFLGLLSYKRPGLAFLFLAVYFMNFIFTHINDFVRAFRVKFAKNFAANSLPFALVFTFRCFNICGYDFIYFTRYGANFIYLQL